MRYHKDTPVGLFSAEERLAELKELGDPLLTLSRHVDFEFFRSSLENILYGSYDASKGGRPPFDPVIMFKVLVLQRLYNLSDDALEYQIKDRLSFMRFLGLDFASRIPDAKTVWQFRDQLQRHGLVKKLFDQMNADLERRNIIANSGQIVDASFVQAPRQRNKEGENEKIKAGTVPAPWKKNPHRLCQKDTDARWAKKNNEVHFGYKDHVICDRKSKIVKDYVVTHAAVHDSGVIEALISSGAADHQTLYADSAYRSTDIEDKLAKRTIKSRVHHKAFRNRPLTAAQKTSNVARSRKRARVEHVFGFMKNSMGGMVVRCCSKARNEAVIGLMNLTYNLCRVMQLDKWLGLSTA